MQITEIERVACTLLRLHVGQVYAPVIREYTEQVVESPDYASHLQEGHHPNDMEWRRKEAGAFDYKSLPGGERDSAWLLDKAVADLAAAVVMYRRRGRPEGDVTIPLSTSGIAVITSLAAHVAEFHQALLSAFVERQ